MARRSYRLPRSLGVLVSWNTIGDRKKLFYTLFLFQQVAMLGIFVSLDLFLYYAFWELSLVPMTLLIATFGRSSNRRRAAIKYFLYTFIPSAILLVGMLWVYARTGTFQLPDLAQLAATHSISNNSAALWLASLAFLVAFAVKVPVFPLHGWLADAIAEAPTAAVMVLVGKLGLYSILRFSFSIFPEQSRHIAPLMIALGAIGIVYGALIALVQNDLKQLAAYGTLGHVSVVILGIFTFTIAGIDGGIYQTLNEGIGGAPSSSSSASSTSATAPTTCATTAASPRSCPGWSPSSSSPRSRSSACPCSTASSANSWSSPAPCNPRSPTTPPGPSSPPPASSSPRSYMLWMIQRVFYGDLSMKSADVPARDLTAREHLALWPLVALMLLMGVASPYWMRAIDTAGTCLATAIRQPPPHPCYAMLAPPQQSTTSTTAHTPPAQGGHANVTAHLNVLALLPEFILTLTGVLVMLAEPCLKPTASRKPLGWLAILGTVARRRRQLVSASASAPLTRLLRHHPGRRLLRLLPSPHRRHRPRHPAQLARLLRGQRHATPASTSPSPSSAPSA